MVQQAESDAIAWKQGGNRRLFTKKSYAKRMWMGFFVQYAVQTTGAMVVYGELRFMSILQIIENMLILSVYVVQLYKNLGESGGIPLVLGAAYVTVAAASNFVGALIMDNFGRVNLLSRPLPTNQA